jgi:hypothetical protein
MFNHIMIGSNDISRSKKFYDALFTAMGAQPATENARGRLAYSHNGGRFMVTKQTSRCAPRFSPGPRN